MGLGKFFKKMFSGEAAPETLEGDFEETDDELALLWRDRATLSPRNQGLLRVEYALRGLPVPVERPDPRPGVPLTEELFQPEREPGQPAPHGEQTDFVSVLSPSSVCVKGADGTSVAVALRPWRSTEALDTPSDAALTVAFAGAEVAGEGEVASLDELGDDGREVGDLRVRHLADHGEVLLVASDDEDFRVLVGPAVPLVAVAAAAATHVIGGLRWPATIEEWSAAADAWDDDLKEGFTAAWILAEAAGVHGPNSHLLADTLGLYAFATGTALAPQPLSQHVVAAALAGSLDAEAPGAVEAEAPGAVEAETLADAAGWLLFEGELDAAESLLGRADELHPGDGALLFARGELQRLRGDADAAREAFEAAGAAEEPYGRAFCNLTVMAHEAGDPEGALKMAEKAAELLTGGVEAGEERERMLLHPVALYNLAIALWRTGDRAAAMDVVQGAARQVTPWTRTLLEVLVDEGDPEERPAPFRNVRFYAALAWERAHRLHERSGSPEALAAARRLLERALELEPTYGEAITLLADVRSAQGDADAALDVLDAGLERLPLHAPLHAVRAELRASLEDFEGAADDYSRVLELTPERRDIVPNLVLALIRAGHSGAAEDRIAVMEQEGDDNRVVAALRGVVRYYEQAEAE